MSTTNNGKCITTAIYTVYSEQHRAHCEQQASFRRPYFLTAAGCERLIRRGDVDRDSRPTANVVRIERATLG